MSDMGQTGSGPDGSEVVLLEYRLLEPDVRRQPALVRALLHPEFVEFGASGQVWDTESVVVALASAPAGPPVTATHFETVVLAPDVVLLTFRTESAGGSCLRSSVWVRLPGGSWCLRFHQATVLPDGVDVD